MPEAPVLPLLDAALRGGLLALLLLLSQLLWRDRPALPSARVALALAAGLAVQVIGATPLLEDRLPWAWQMPLVAVSVANVVLFWIFIRALFDDDFRPGLAHGLAWAALAGLALANCLMGPPGPAGASAGAAVLWLSQRLATAGFALLAALAALRHWQQDLVEGRRRLRLFVVISGVAYTLGMLGVRLASPQGRLSAPLATLDVLLLLAMLGVLAWRLLAVGRSELFPLAAGAPVPGSARADPTRLSAVQAAGVAEGAGPVAVADLDPATATATAAPAATLAPPDAAETRLPTSALHRPRWREFHR